MAVMEHGVLVYVQLLKESLSVYKTISRTKTTFHTLNILKGQCSSRIINSNISLAWEVELSLYF